MKPILSIIGAGKVGRVLGKQFHQHAIFTIGDVLNRSLSSSASACDFIGAGKPVTEFAQLTSADIFMLAVPDDQIKTCSLQLISHQLIKPETIVFHCSGALCASELQLPSGAASCHPVRSFADPEQVAHQFSNTICSLEGDANATLFLSQALTRAGAQIVMLESQGKSLYHAAAVFASNYLVTLMEAALTTYQAAGISPEMAKRMAEPLAMETLTNVFRLGPQQALTGPIARGDYLTVEQHQQALTQWNQDYANLYNGLATATKTFKSRESQN